jgi:hypothetical protein
LKKSAQGGYVMALIRFGVFPAELAKGLSTALNTLQQEVNPESEPEITFDEEPQDKNCIEDDSPLEIDSEPEEMENNFFQAHQADEEPETEPAISVAHPYDKAKSHVFLWSMSFIITLMIMNCLI